MKRQLYKIILCIILLSISWQLSSCTANNSEREKEYLKELAALEEKYGTNSTELLPTLSKLVSYYYKIKTYDKAEYIYKHLISISYENDKDKDYVKYLKHLAALYRFQGKEAKAAALYTSTIAENEAKYGVNEPFVQWLKSELIENYNAYAMGRKKDQADILTWFLLALFLLLYLFVAYASIHSATEDIKAAPLFTFFFVQVANIMIIAVSSLFFFNEVFYKEQIANHISLIFVNEFVLYVVVAISYLIAIKNPNDRVFTYSICISTGVFSLIYYLASKNILITLLLCLQLVSTASYRNGFVKNLINATLLIFLSYKLADAVSNTLGLLPEMSSSDSLFDIPTLALWGIFYFALKSIIYMAEFTIVKTQKSDINVFNWLQKEPDYKYDINSLRVEKPKHIIETLPAKCVCGQVMQIPLGFQMTEIVCPNCKRRLKIPSEKLEQLKTKLSTRASHHVGWESIPCKACKFNIQVSPAFNEHFIVCPICGHKNILV
ncbi:MAG: tetratricopeptide repeat protein [Candidatus Magnetoovum sp. WYHC-5]|nr:tetratricopeptide repeat protein [Candidatus Magnetoovum sp. WYHC-5]